MRTAWGVSLCPERCYPTAAEIMKTSTLYVMLIATGSLLCYTTAGLSQNLDIPVSIDLTRQPLKQLLDLLKEKTRVSFIFDTATGAELVTITATGESARQVLERALQDVGLTYIYNERSRKITIRRIPENTDTPANDTFIISGNVIDEASREPLAGVNVLVKGTTHGTSANAEGHYSLNVRPGDILVFTFIGFKPSESTVGQRTIIDVTLESDATALNEVEVIGNSYYATARENSTSSIVKINAKDIENQPVTSPLLALQGRVAGLEITPTTGAPGNAPKIRVRGTNSLRDQGNYPLYIIDGMPINSQPLQSVNGSLMNGGFDPLANISPANIESIEVLKDGDATAIYGSRGANGVIVIRTKINKNDSGTHIDFTAYTGTGEVSKHLDMMNSQQYLEMRHEAFKNDKAAPTRFTAPDLFLWDTTRYTDPQRQLLHGSSSIADLQGNLSGGKGNTTFRLGGGYHKETTIFAGNFGYSRINGQFNFNYVSTNQRLNVGFFINYGVNNNKLFNDFDLMRLALQLPPVIPKLYTPAGDLNFEPDESGNSTFANPLLLLRKQSQSKATNLFANTLLTYEILPGLVAKTNFGYTDLISNENMQIPIASVLPESRPFTTGQSIFATSTRRAWLIEPQVRYTRSFGRHRLDLFVGTTVQQSDAAYEAISATGYTNDAMLGTIKVAPKLSVLDDDAARYKYASIIARVAYNFDSKYVVNLTGRRDGSSRFGPDNLWGNFGSAAAAWIFTREPFMQRQRVISFGKIRTSFALTGNDQIGDYKYYNTYTNSTWNYQSGTSLSPASLYNPGFQWETTRKWEIAIELGFLQNKISLEINHYRNSSSNQLIGYRLPATTGFPTVFKNFDAVIGNTGWELMATSINLTGSKFRWITSANISFPTNTLVEFPNIENSSYAQFYAIGKSLSSKRLYTFQGVNPQTGTNMFLDLNNNQNIDNADKQFVKDLQQKYYGGLTNTLQWYGLEITLLFQFANRPAERYIPLSPPGTNINQPQYMLDRWTHEGDVAGFAKYSQAGIAGYLDLSKLTQSDYAVADGSFIRLKTLTCAYTLPTVVVQKIHVAETKLFVQGQNLFTKTNYFNLDPETGLNLPPLRIWTMGLLVKL
jgi:TonB-dependent starch-binding outer membrane protein SusC